MQLLQKQSSLEQHGAVEEGGRRVGALEVQKLLLWLLLGEPPVCGERVSVSPGEPLSRSETLPSILCPPGGGK